MPTKETSKILPEKITLDYSVKEGFNQIEPKTSIRRHDTGIGRTYYDPDDKDRKYIYSSTTILGSVLNKGFGFNSWLKLHGNDCDRLMNEAATKGTIIHICCSIIAAGEDLHTDMKLYDKGKTFEITEAIYNNVLAFKKFYLEHRPIIKAIELSLYDRNILWAGTADYIMVMDIKGKPRLCLLDIKSGKEYPKNHELQLVSYKILFDSIFGKEHGTIDEIYSLYLKDTGNYKLKKYKFNEQEWYSTLHLFHYMNSNAYGKMPKIKPEFEMDKIITLKENE